MAQHASSTPSPGDAHAVQQVVHTHHVIDPMVYYRVFAALMILFALTVLAAFFDVSHLTNWPPANLIIALVIAVIKAMVVILYFMHLKYSSRLAQLFAAASLVFLCLMFIFTFADYFTRGWIPQPASWTFPGR